MVAEQFRHDPSSECFKAIRIFTRGTLSLLPQLEALKTRVWIVWREVRSYACGIGALFPSYVRDWVTRLKRIGSDLLDLRLIIGSYQNRYTRVQSACCQVRPPAPFAPVAGCQPDGSEWRRLGGPSAGLWLKVLPDGSGETYDPAGNHISPIPDPPGSWFVKCKPAAATVAANPGAVCPPGTRRTAGANGLQAWTYCAPIQPIVPLNQ
jgi:hypothetical protein